MMNTKSSRIPSWSFERDLGESHDDYGMVHNVLMALQSQRKGGKRARSFLNE